MSDTPHHPDYDQGFADATAELAAAEAAKPGLKHAMVDIETLGTKPFCPVLSIGACAFNLDDELPIVDVFYQAIKLDSCLELGMRVNADTLQWWLDQQPEVLRAAMLDPAAVTLPLALDAFTDWIESRPLHLWGNSARFDMGILEAAYQACSKELPWEHWRERDYRTVKSIAAAKAVELQRVGRYHHALDDAVSQAKHLRAICKQLQLQF